MHFSHDPESEPSVSVPTGRCEPDGECEPVHSALFAGTCDTRHNRIASMTITRATCSDCRTIAELAMIAGEGIRAYFWAQSQQQDEDICDVGARSASSETDNSSYRNAWLVRLDNQTAGMLLANPCLIQRMRKPARVCGICQAFHRAREPCAGELLHQHADQLPAVS